MTLSYYSKPLEESMALRDIRILVAIDFGRVRSQKKPLKVLLPGRQGNPKTSTALLHDKEYRNVICWGYSALEEEPDEELDDPEERNEKPWLPGQLTYKQAIVDYLTQMRKLIKETLETRWPTIKFPQQVDLVFTIPAEWYPPNTTIIMRECAYNAGLLTSLASNNIEFTTEPEAAALHCLKVVKENNLNQGVYSFLVADCGGGTVDLTSRKLLPDNKKVGFKALESLKSNNYGQMQFLVQRFFCQ
ncbi:13053_t:CDS:2, partial [Funneliformis caledonium]